MLPAEDIKDFNSLLEYLRQTRGFDFSGYKQSSLMRRIRKRMQTVDVSQYSDYMDYLEVHPDEFNHLFNGILINVTSFFRDQDAWDFLEKAILPRILEGKQAEDSVRVWSTGCASGEEAYTMAMHLAEALGDEQFRQRVKIYATDVDDEALAQARLGVYSEKEVEGVPPALLEKYFAPYNGGYSFHKDLRRNLIFGRNDLVQDAPISHIDLLLCRNTLMYFNAETQRKILARFHFALNEEGFLFLGKAEMLLTHSNLFTTVDLKQRVFTKVPRADLRDRLLLMAQASQDINNPAPAVNHNHLRERAFEAQPVAQLVLDPTYRLVVANEQARHMFHIGPTPMTRPFLDLEISYHSMELRGAIQRSYIERAPVTLRDMEWRLSGQPLYFDVFIQPLKENGSTLLGLMLSFLNVTQQKYLQNQLEQSNHELEAAFEELQSTNEELETTNEELQSTIEELETTNEELQSTNEELETMNEELQSTNEELQTMNDELGQRTEELNQVNAFMESILGSVRSAVIVMDKDLRVQVWNRNAEDLWGLRSDEVVGRNFLNLDIGLPVEKLKKPLLACLTGEADDQDIRLEALNRRGRSMVCSLCISPLLDKNKIIQGAIVMMEDDEISQGRDGRQHVEQPVDGG